MPEEAARRIGAQGLTACVASSDVHEHGKNLISRVLAHLGVGIVDGGTSADAEDLVAAALAAKADVIAISTYNGIALRYAREVKEALARAGVKMPVCIGGRLNQVLDDSNSGLPVDVTADIRQLGVIPCDSPDGLFRLLDNLSTSNSTAHQDSP